MLKKVILMLAMAVFLQPCLASAKKATKTRAPVSVEAKLNQAWELYNIGKYKQVLSIVEPLAAQGVSRAQVILGDCYDNGVGVGQAPAIAAQWYQLAADQGDPIGMARLGYAYWAGSGVPKDFNMALQWLTRAAELGNESALETLAIWDIEGKLNE